MPAALDSLFSWLNGHAHAYSAFFLLSKVLILGNAPSSASYADMVGFKLSMQSLMRALRDEVRFPPHACHALLSGHAAEGMARGASCCHPARPTRADMCWALARLVCRSSATSASQ